MNFLDISLPIIIVLGFFYLVYMRLIKKYPRLREQIGGLFTGEIYKQIPIPKEEKKQVWTEQRSMI